MDITSHKIIRKLSMLNIKNIPNDQLKDSVYQCLLQCVPLSEIYRLSPELFKIPSIGQNISVCIGRTIMVDKISDGYASEYMVIITDDNVFAIDACARPDTYLFIQHDTFVYGKYRQIYRSEQVSIRDDRMTMRDISQWPLAIVKWQMSSAGTPILSRHITDVLIRNGVAVIVGWQYTIYWTDDTIVISGAGVRKYTYPN